jgi:hypothetical protein
LSQAGTEVHAISQVFTGAVYDILADVFALERDPALEDCASVLHRVAGWLRGLLLRALIAAPDAAASFADVANEMLRIAAEDGKPQAVVNAIRDRFAQREVFAVPAGFTGDHPAGLRLVPLVTDAPGARQDRRACCGTMNLPEYNDVERVLQAEADALARWCAEHGRPGAAPAALLALATVTVTDAAGAAVGTTAVVHLPAPDKRAAHPALPLSDGPQPATP